MAVRMCFAMTSTELVALLRRDPELEVEFDGHRDFEVSFRGHSDREANFGYRGELLPISGGCELRADFAAPRAFALIGYVWLALSLLVLARLVALAFTDSQSDHPWLRALIGVAFVASGALVIGIGRLTGSMQEDGLKRRIEELATGKLLIIRSTTRTQSL